MFHSDLYPSSLTYYGDMKFCYCIIDTRLFLHFIADRGQTKCLNAAQRRNFVSNSKLNFQFTASLKEEDKNPPSGTSGGKGPSKGKDGQLCCPKCGKPCTHVETFVCK